MMLARVVVIRVFVRHIPVSVTLLLLKTMSFNLADSSIEHGNEGVDP